MKNINIKNSSDLERLKESFNKTLDNRIKAEKLNEKISELDTLGLGETKALFEGVSDRLFDNHKNCVAKYIKTIKENKALKTLYSLYECALKPSRVNDVNLLVSSMVSISEGVDKKALKEGLSKLNSVVKECVVKSNIDSETIDEILSNNKELNEALDFVFTNKKNTKNLFEYTNNLQRIVQHINENMAEEVEESEEKCNEELIGDLNEAISRENSWETEALRDLTLCFLSESSKEDLFNQYKSDCMNILEEKIAESDNIEEHARFTSMKESLCKKQYNENVLKESILKMAELKYTLSE